MYCTCAPFPSDILDPHRLQSLSGEMAAQAVEYFVLLTVAGTQPEDYEENYIVLFSWAVISKSRNQVLTKEQLYVQPSHTVNPSNLPGGIKPEAVTGAAPLSVIIKQFQTAVSKLGQSFMLLCPNSQPLRHFLHREARSYNIELDHFFYQYVDINTEFSRGFPDNQRPESLEDMCAFLGIDVAPSSPKLGLAELKMVADITQKLIMQGHTFGNPERIKNENDYKDPVNTSLVEEGNVVSLRGLPYDADVEDVAKFLSGLNIVTKSRGEANPEEKQMVYFSGGIVFGISSVGRRTGEATVILETPEQAELAIKRHKYFIESRYIEVYEVTPDEFLRQVGGQDSSPVHVGVVRMQGLPYRAIEEDIVDFFGPEAPVKEKKGGVMIVRFPDGRASGDAMVLFDNDQDLERALQKNKEMMGSRYVQLFRSSLKEFQMVLSKSGSADQQQHFVDLLSLNVAGGKFGDDVVRGNEKNCVKLRGLPYSASAEDVIAFFDEYGSDIAPHGIHMVLNAVNRATGDCYVQMLSEEAAAKVARRLHKKTMGHRYIEIFECTGDDVAQALAEGSSGSGGYSGGYQGEGRGYRGRGEGGGGWYRGGGGGGGRGGRQRHNSGGGVIVKAKGLPYSTQPREVAHFFQEYEVRERDCEIVYDSNGRSTGIAYVTFQSRAMATLAVREKERKNIGSRYVELSLN